MNNGIKMNKEPKVIDITTSENSENTQLIKTHEVKDTPFTIVESEKGIFIALANYRLTENFNTVEEAEKEANKITWNRITQVILILIEKQK